MAPVRVDLGDSRIARDAGQWFDLAVEVAAELLSSRRLDANELYANDDEFLRTAQAFCLMTEAYRQRRGEMPDVVLNGAQLSTTERSAISTIAIMQFRPFRIPSSVGLVLHPWAPVANQDLALACAGVILDREFTHLTSEMQHRLFDMLGRIGGRGGPRVRCLKQYIEDQRAGRYLKSYEIDITRDMPLIDSLILLYGSPLRP